MNCKINYKTKGFKSELDMVRFNGLNIKHVKNPTKELCIEAINEDATALLYINNPDDELKFLAIKKLPFMVTKIDNPTEEMYIEAVKRNGLTIMHIENQTENMCIYAVRNNAFVYPYAKFKTHKVNMEAIRKHPSIIQKIENLTKDECMEAISIDPTCINLIASQDTDMAKLAIEKDIKSLEFINKDVLKELEAQNYLKYKELVDSKVRNVKAFKLKDSISYIYFVGCQKAITKDEFIYRIHNIGGDIKSKPYRQKYIEFINSIES